ncbi:MAG: PD-(D/E)XK nuclease family protein [Clostridia bacterium]|nr:PD-(D/E)XK nuclease family protein [Clostridia bacterium]
MPMTLILGRVGCGKTGYMARRITEKLEGLREGEQITLVVPDQYTVASENYFLDRVGEKNFRRLNVTSLKSLARTEFAAHGIPSRFIGEGGKTVLLKKAYEAVSPSLKHYPPDYRNPRFLPLLLGAIKELKTAGISAEDLMDTALRTKNEKLYDLAMIRQVYEGYLSQGYFDPDDVPERLCKLLEETGDFENEWVYVANFRSFYNRERNILLQMVKNGANVVISLPTDTLDPEAGGATADAAAEGRELTARCRALGEECKVDLLQDRASFPSEEFALLEAEFSRSTEKTYGEKPAHVHLFRGADRFDEAEYAASVIARKVREEGYRYSDFAVIVRTLSDYAEVLDPIFDQYEIPLFYHRRTPLRQRSPMPFIEALFSMAAEGLSRENVLAFVKSGFCTTPEKASWFERYVNVWKVSYNRFQTPFLRPIEGFVKQETPRQTVMREGAEEVRRKVADTVRSFQERTQNATVREISTALYETLQTLKVPEILDRNARDYREHGEYELAERQKKVYEQLMLALDEIVLTAGDDRLSLQEYRDLFFAVVDTHDVAILPTSLDEVTAGSPETLPMTSPRCAFVLGLNEGVFPLNIRDDGLLTDEDRRQLSPFGIGETTDDKILHEMFYTYTALTAPREDLYLTYATVVGGEVMPSSVVDRVKKCFPALETESFSPSDPASLSLRLQRERAAFALHTKTPVSELSEYFDGVPFYRDILAKRERVTDLSEQAALRLYPENLQISASKTDSYHQCRYAYFLRYGMGISPRRTAELDPMQRGTLIHDALEKIIAQGLDCSDEELHARVAEFGRQQIRKLYGDEAPPENMRSYFAALLDKIERLLKLFRKELTLTQFVPVAFEQKIGKEEGSVPTVEIPLETGTLSLIGVVDRVDVYEKDGVKYLRVVDYKSGAKEFSLRKVENGLDVQMLMYLFALQQNFYPDAKVVPAGVQYIGANPAVAGVSRSLSPEQALVQWERNTPRSGLYLKDDGILDAMDPTEERLYLKISKKTQSRSDYLVTQERFGEIFEGIVSTLRKMGNELHGGKLEKNPMRIGSKYDSCAHCDLKYYCRAPEPRDVLAEEEAKRADAEKGDPSHA